VGTGHADAGGEIEEKLRQSPFQKRKDCHFGFKAYSGDLGASFFFGKSDCQAVV
jgi:hypothetical protein